MRNKKRRVFRRKGYLLILPPVLAWPAIQAHAVQTCQGDQVITSCQASRQSLSGGSANWRVADDQWLIFQNANENTSGGAVFQPEKSQLDWSVPTWFCSSANFGLLASARIFLMVLRAINSMVRRETGTLASKKMMV